MAQGDHIRVNRGLYWHHGIDCGDGTVIHLAGELLDTASALVVRAPMDDFARGGAVEVMDAPRAYVPELIVARAESRLGTPGLPGFCSYEIVSNNCEHFARWCCVGVGTSCQVKQTLRFAGKVAAAVAALLLLRRFP